MSSLGLTKEARRMVIVLILGAILVVLNQTLLSPALPGIMTTMNVSATTVQWLTSAYSLTEAVMIPFAAWFMGRFSTRKLFISGMGLFATGSLVAALAPVFGVLLLGRVLQAMATGILMVMVMSLMLLSFPREKRGQAMGLVSLVIAFAPAIGPSLGGLLEDLVGWRVLFGIVAVLAVVVVLFASRVLTNYEGFSRTSADGLSIVLSTVGLVMLLYGLSSFASSPYPALCAILIVLGIAVIALFAKRQASLREPMLKLEVLKSRRYRTACLTVCVLNAVLIGLGVLMPLYTQNVLGYSATLSGLVTLPGAVIGAVAGLFAGRIYDRFGIRKIALASVIVTVAGGIGLLMYRADSSLAEVIIVATVTNIGIQLLFTPLSTWGVNSLENRLVQHATSVTSTVNQVGASLGTALIMSFSALGSSMSVQSEGVGRVFDGYHLSFIVTFVLILVVFFAVVIFARDKASDAMPSSTTEGKTETSDVRTVADIMDEDVVTIPANATIGQATQLLSSTGASGAVLVDGSNAVRGFLSNSDILSLFGDRMEAVTGMSGFVALRMTDNADVKTRANEIADLRAQDYATKQVVSVEPTTTFEAACEKIAERRLKELPVVENGKLVGVVRRRSLMRYLSGVFRD